MAPKGRRGVLVTTSKAKKVQQEEDDRLESQKEWASCDVMRVVSAQNELDILCFISRHADKSC